MHNSAAVEVLRQAWQVPEVVLGSILLAAAMLAALTRDVVTVSGVLIVSGLALLLFFGSEAVPNGIKFAMVAAASALCVGLSSWRIGRAKRWILRTDASINRLDERVSTFLEALDRRALIADQELHDARRKLEAMQSALSRRSGESPARTGAEGVRQDIQDPSA